MIVYPCNVLRDNDVRTEALSGAAGCDGCRNCLVKSATPFWPSGTRKATVSAVASHSIRTAIALVAR
jgi:hypothetical protein